MTGLRFTLPDTEWLNNYCDPEIVSVEHYKITVETNLFFANRRKLQNSMVEKYFTQQREIARELNR